MSINPDKITTVLGLVIAFSTAAAQQNIEPRYTGAVAAIATVLLGFFTNKLPSKV